MEQMVVEEEEEEEEEEESMVVVVVEMVEQAAVEDRDVDEKKLYTKQKYIYIFFTILKIVIVILPYLQL